MLSFGRKLWPLLLLLVVSAAFAAAQNRSFSRGTASVAQRPAIAVLRPFEGGMTAFNRFCAIVASATTGRTSLVVENNALKRQVALLTLRNDHLLHLADENTRLRRLLKMNQHDASAQRWVAADVVERQPSHWFQFLTVNRGTRSGIKQHSVVLTADGLVGQVVTVRPDASDVLLLTDPTSNAGAIVSRTHDVGYVQGTGHTELELRFYARDHGIRIGDAVVSSPFSALYPSGILIGRISAISRDSPTGANSAVVEPAVHFNTMDSALVIP
ncbi:MAG: rod shape-determining protein MreC [Chloroflexi bacterium]|nr:rod shape-determining protein MreC [Chloroflexota bacterium]